MKRRVWISILGVVVAGAAVFGVIVWDLKRKAAATLIHHETEAKAKFAEFRSRSWRRAVLGEPEVSGNRWDDFTKALAAFDAIPQTDLNELPSFREDVETTPDPAILDRIFLQHRPAVELLRAACRRPVLVPPYVYEDAFAMDLPHVDKAIQTSKFLQDAGVRLRDLGKDREAMEHALLAIAVSQDVACGGPVVNFLVGLVCGQHGNQAARSILESHALGAKDLEALADALDRLEATRPSCLESLEIEDAMARYGLVQIVLAPKVGTMSLGQLPRLWRYLFSGDLMMAEALNEFERFYQDASGLQGKPLPERRSAAEKLIQRALDSRNPMVALLLPALARVLTRDAVAGMSRNLLRTAVALAWYEAERGSYPTKLEDLVPRHLPRVLDCPFSGKPFGYAQGKVWSFGGDGDDDQGRPMVDEDREEEDGDVVWTVKRRK